MGIIGDSLKQERTARGLTVADVHEATKISVHNLMALEEEDFDSFANRVYARAFLRDYANYLGLDSARLLEEYEAMFSVTVAPPEPVRKRPPLALAAVILLIACAGYAGIHHGVTGKWPFVKAKLQQSHVSVPQAPTEPALPASGKPAPGVEDTGSPSVSEQERPTGQPPDSATSPAPADSTSPPDSEETALVTDDQLTVTIAAVQKSWIQIWLDGKSVYFGNLAPGDISHWTAKKTVKLHTGNAGGIKVTVDGKPQPTLGRSGQVVTQTWRKTPTAQNSPAPSNTP